MENRLNPQRIRHLILLGLVLAAVVALTAGLPNLIVGEGRSVVTENPLNDQVVDVGSEVLDPINTIPAGIISIFFALIVAASVFMAIRYKKVRYFLTWIVVGAVIAFLIYTFINSQDIELEPQPQQFAEAAKGESTVPEVIEAPDFITEPANWITLAISFGIGVVSIGIAVMLYRRWDQPQMDLPPLVNLAHEAEITLVEIRAGADVKDAILRCYENMTRAVRIGKGTMRQEGSTPREFAATLAASGLPVHSVERLTKLFEIVRYGGHDASQREKLEAVACMEEIIAAARPENSKSQPAAIRSQPTAG